MKILYCSSWQKLELDFANSSVARLGTDLRLPIIEAMINLGHEVSFPDTAKIELPSGNKEMFRSNLTFDYNFLNKITKFTKIQDYELMFIEGGCNNTIFEKGVGWFNLAGLLNNFNGNVIYYHHGDMVTMAFPFGDCIKETDSDNPLNLRNILSAQSLAGKKWKVLTHAIDTEKMCKMIKQSRFMYSKIGVPIEFMPIGYSKNFDRKQGNKRKPLKYDLLYIGNQRDDNRKNKLLKFLSNTELNIAVIGKWEYKGLFENINFLGRMGGHGEIYDFYNDALSTLQIGDLGFEKIGMRTTRIAQAICSETILFTDGEILKPEEFTLPDNVIETKEDLMRRILHYKNCDLELENDIAAQKEMLSEWRDVIGGAILNSGFANLTLN
jgi:hypothetical protein